MMPAKKVASHTASSSWVRPVYSTPLGRALVGQAQDALDELPDESVDLVMTSPPFALLREKEYGNLDEGRYVDWLLSFGPGIRRVLKETGSFVLDLGGAYRRGLPVRSLYNYRILLRLCDEHKFHLAEEFFWHNPCKLPSPIEWVNKRKIRAKDSVNTVWWLAKSPWPKADVRNVLAEYSPRMRQLIAQPSRFGLDKERPSGHEIGLAFARDNGGAIPSNLLQYPNTDSNSLYLRLCKRFALEAHPARFPTALPDFFIRFLTEQGDTVIDPFAGSNAAGWCAERLGRKWLSIDSSGEYVLASAFRFMEGWEDSSIGAYIEAVRGGDGLPVRIEPKREEGRPTAPRAGRRGAIRRG